MAYAPRPSANLLERDIDSTRAYVSDLKGYVGQIRSTLDVAGFFDAANDNPVFDRADTNLDGAITDLDTAYARHRENVDAADIAKTDRQWEKEQKRHLRAIKKGKMF